MMPFITQPALAPACYKARERVEQSQVFNSAALAHLAKTFGAAPTSTTTGTFVCWIQRGKLSQLQDIFRVWNGATNAQELRFKADNTLASYHDVASVTYEMSTSQAFRDTAGFAMLTEEFETSHVDAAERRRLHVGGGRITGFSVNTASPLNSPITIGSASLHHIGLYTISSAYPLDAILSEVYYVDGAALPPQTFGEYNIHGEWVPKPRAEIYAGINAVGGFGTNGWHLDFSDPLNPGLDVSGRGNHWTATGFDVTGKDTVASSPTKVYPVVNPLLAIQTAYLSYGGWKIAPVSARTFIVNWFLPAGRYHWRVDVSGSGGGGRSIGLLTRSDAATADLTQMLRTLSGSVTYDGLTGKRYQNGVDLGAWGAAWGDAASVGVWYDADAGAVWYDVDGVLQGGATPAELEAGDTTHAAFTGIAEPVFPAIGSENGFTFLVNFGQWGRPYDLASNFDEVSTATLPEPDVKDPAEGYVGETATGANILAVLDAATAHWDGADYVEIIKRRDADENFRIRTSDDPDNSWPLNVVAPKAAAAALAAGGSYVGRRLRVGEKYGIFTAEINHVAGVATTVTHGLATARNAVIAVRVSGGGDYRYYRHPDMPTGYLAKLDTAGAAAADTTITSFGADSFDIGAVAPTGAYRVIVLAERYGFLELLKHLGTGQAGDAGAFASASIISDWALIRSTSGAAGILFDGAINPTNPAVRRFYTHGVGGDADGTAAGEIIDMVMGGIKCRGTSSLINSSGHTYVTIAFGRPVGGICTAPATTR